MLKKLNSIRARTIFLCSFSSYDALAPTMMSNIDRYKEMTQNEVNNPINSFNKTDGLGLVSLKFLTAYL
jgi:hypothetical protein